jgi:hypothetical protein
MKTLTAQELEELLTALYGPDFRDKVFINAFGSFALADAFDECGLRDPKAPPDTGPSNGLWQFTPSRQPPTKPKT